MEHAFTPVIIRVLTKHFGTTAQDLFEKSPLLQYINIKTVSATRGSKARSSFANLYAIYVLVEDYVANGFHKKGDYSKYAGAQFSKLFKRQRELPFGSKLQNHGHEWVPKKSKDSKKMPVVCPKCHSPYWNNPRRKKS